MTTEERERLQRIADENSVKRTADQQKQFAERLAKMTDEERNRYHRHKDEAEKFLRLVEGTASLEEEADLLLGSPAIDLRALPREQWASCCNVTLPPDVQAQIEARTEITEAELNFIEDRLRTYHGIAWPDWIECRFIPPAMFEAVLLKDLLQDTDPKDYLSRE